MVGEAGAVTPTAHWSACRYRRSVEAAGGPEQWMLSQPLNPLDYSIQSGTASGGSPPTLSGTWGLPTCRLLLDLPADGGAVPLVPGAAGDRGADPLTIGSCLHAIMHL